MRESRIICPKCHAPLNPPEPVVSPTSNFFAFGHIQAQCDRPCTNCGQGLRWDSAGMSEGAWAAAASSSGQIASTDIPSPKGQTAEKQPAAKLVPLGPNSAVVVVPERREERKAKARSARRTVRTAQRRDRPAPRRRGPVPVEHASGLKDRIVSIADVAVSTPWTEAALEKLAWAGDTPFHMKAGIWVARESAVLKWVESDDAGQRRLPPGRMNGRVRSFPSVAS